MTGKALRRKVERQLDVELDKGTDRFLADPGSASSQAFLARVEAYHKIIERLPSGGFPERAVAMTLFVAALSIVLLGWGLPLREIDFVAEVRATEIGMIPAAGAFELGGCIEARAVDVSGLSWIGAIAGGSAIDSPRGDARLSLPGTGVQLHELTVERAASLVWRYVGSDLELVLRDARLSGSLSYLPEPTGSDSPSPGDFEILDFERTVEGAEPVRFYFSSAELRRSPRLSISKVDFLWQISDRTSDNPFRSSILGGEVRILDSAEAHDIAAGDRLHWKEPARFEQLELELSPPSPTHAGSADAAAEAALCCPHLGASRPGLSIRLGGTGGRLDLGPKGHERDLRPSLLQVFSRDKTLAMLWAGLLFVSGVLWKIREVLPR